ncbi:MAG TPA: HK97 family phage prohead protease [Pirellulales bacterium]
MSHVGQHEHAAQGSPIAFKFAAAGNEGTLEGYASTFGGPRDRTGDVVAPGAFKATLAEHSARGSQPAMLWSHDMDQPIGAWDVVKEDGKGLFVKGHLILDVPRAREAYALARDGALALSIGYLTKKSTPIRGGGRRLDAVDLFEISLVSAPANPNARITSIKGMIDVAAITTPRAFEQFLRDAGFPRTFAKGITNLGFNAAAGLRDADVHAASELAREIRASAAVIRKLKRD